MDSLGEPTPTYGVLVFREQEEQTEVLLVRHTEAADHETGKYGLPAGRQESEETARETAIRELQEEAGAIVTIDNLHPVPQTYVSEIDCSDGSSKLFSLDVFVADNYAITPESGKETEPEWVSMDEVSELYMTPDLDDIVCDGHEVYRKLG